MPETRRSSINDRNPPTLKREEADLTEERADENRRVFKEACVSGGADKGTIDQSKSGSVQHEQNSHSFEPDGLPPMA